jgi:CRISPR-associated endonuclease Cas3-HD
MNQVMSGNAGAGSLVREVASRLVVIHDDRDAVLARPFAAETFGLHPGSIYGLVRDWLEREGEVPDGFYPVQALGDRGDPTEGGRSAYEWLPVYDKHDVAGAPLVLVHPALAGYDPNLGFVPDRGTGYRAALAPERDDGAPRPAYGYRLETFGAHAREVYDAFRREAWAELAPAAGRLERVFHWPAGALARAAHLVVLLHDVGKLNRPWQGWVQRYQKAIGAPAPAGFYAHTDFEPDNPLHREKQQALGRRAPHAVEGAVATVQLLEAGVGDCEAVIRAAFTAIARHHGAFSSEYRAYRLAPGAVTGVAEILTWLPAELSAGLKAGGLLTECDPAEFEIDWLLIDPGDDGQFLAYALLARALRRADQAGTARGSTLHRI